MQKARKRIREWKESLKIKAEKNELENRKCVELLNPKTAFLKNQQNRKTTS